jgi:hypothetical protein
MVSDKARGVFIDQNQTSVLIRLARFASPIKLRMGLKDAEQLVVVGNLLVVCSSYWRDFA